MKVLPLTLSVTLSGIGGDSPGNKSSMMLLNKGTSLATNLGMLLFLMALITILDSSTSRFSESLFMLEVETDLV